MRRGGLFAASIALGMLLLAFLLSTPAPWRMVLPNVARMRVSLPSAPLLPGETVQSFALRVRGAGTIVMLGEMREDWGITRVGGSQPTWDIEAEAGHFAGGLVQGETWPNLFTLELPRRGTAVVEYCFCLESYDPVGRAPRTVTLFQTNGPSVVNWRLW